MPWSAVPPRRSARAAPSRSRDTPFGTKARANHAPRTRTTSVTHTDEGACTMPGTDERLYQRAVEVMPGGNTRSTLFVEPHPPYAVRGKGAEVTDVEGHVVIDCNNNYTALIHGHADPEILDVAREVAADGTA